MSSPSRDRDAANRAWLMHNDQDEPERKMPWPCRNCGHNRWAPVTCVRCSYGNPPVWTEDDEFELHRTFAENDRDEAKW